MNPIKIAAAMALTMLVAASGCADEETGPDTPNPTATPRGEGNPPSLGQQVDRVGRAAISTALIATFEADDSAKGQLKDDYNAAGPSDWASFADEMEKNLAILDSLDAECGNQLVADQDPTNRYAFLAAVLADDQLYVLSTTGECGVYLGLEAEIVGAVPAGEGKCGGRMPSEDVIDRSYSVLAAGVLTGVDDTIVADDGAQTSSFPFLGPPSGS
jgi:hypothetical protein